MQSSIDIDDVIMSALRRRADNDDEQDEDYFKSLIGFVNWRQEYNEDAASSNAPIVPTGIAAESIRISQSVAAASQ